MKVGIMVHCTTRGRIKQPHGRSGLAELNYCDFECKGYAEPPLPGCLWPGETAEEFGYDCCNNATEER